MKKLTRYILSRFGGNAITKDEIRETCKRFGADVDSNSLLDRLLFLIKILCNTRVTLLG
jgi:hypothetical protein